MIHRKPRSDGKRKRKGTYRQSPFVAPFWALGEQAQERWPERDPEHIREKVDLNRKLRMEFHGLKQLINDVNTTIENIAQMNGLKAALQLSKLHAMILQDVVACSGVAQKVSASQVRLGQSSSNGEWADIVAALLMQTTAYKRAIQKIQKDYFASHPILYKDIEIAFEMTIQMVQNAIVAFNEYCKVKVEPSYRESNQEQQKARMTNSRLFERKSSLQIDIEAVEKRAEILVDFIVQKWVRSASFKGTADILLENGTHEEFVWEHFQKAIRLECRLR
jgi:hypothetical protein